MRRLVRCFEANHELHARPHTVHVRRASTHTLHVALTHGVLPAAISAYACSGKHAGLRGVKLSTHILSMQG